MTAPKPTQVGGEPQFDFETACRCGHVRGNPMVSAVGEYSGWGWFCVLFGITTRPNRLVYKCRACGDTVSATRDLHLRDQHV